MKAEAQELARGLARGCALSRMPVHALRWTPLLATRCPLKRVTDAHGSYPGLDRCSKPPRQINARNDLAMGVKLQVGARRYQVSIRGIKNSPKEH